MQLRKTLVASLVSLTCAFSANANAQSLCTQETLAQLLYKASVEYRVPIFYYYGIIKAESNWDINAKSHKGATGLMQLMPHHAKRFGLKERDLLNPCINVQIGTHFFAELLYRYGDVNLALAAYNAGEGAVKKYNGIPPYEETRKYIFKVKKHIIEYAMLYGQYQANFVRID